MEDNQQFKENNRIFVFDVFIGKKKYKLAPAIILVGTILYGELLYEVLRRYI